MRYLLDVDVLIALAFPRHTLHQRAHSWFEDEPDRRWATCPLTQGGLLRTASRLLGGTRDAMRQAFAGLELDCWSQHHEFWPVEADLRDLGETLRARLLGPNQITDMQPLMLVHRRRGLLATLDSGVQELAAGTRYAGSLLLL